MSHDRRNRRVTHFVLSVALVSGVSPAWARRAPHRAPAAAAPAAGPSAAAKAAAKQHYGIAEGLFKQQRYEEAIAEYQAAYDAWPLDGFLFNIGQCQRNLGHTAVAISYFEKYLASPTAKNRPDVEAVLLELRKEPAAATPAATPAAPEPVAAQTTPAVAATEPPKPPPSETTAVPSAALTPAPATSESKPVYKKKWFWGAVVGGAVIVAAGVTAGALASTRLPEGSLGTADWR